MRGADTPVLSNPWRERRRHFVRVRPMKHCALWFLLCFFLVLAGAAPVPLRSRRSAVFSAPVRRTLLQRRETALQLAWLATDGPAEELRLLIEDGVDPDTDFNGTPPIWRAAAHNNLATVEVLVDVEADLDATNANGTTALYIASQSGFMDVAEALLEAGADPNVVSTWGSTALSVAVASDQRELTDLLVENDANVSAVLFGSSQSLLWTAAFNGNEDAVRRLLERGADVDQGDANEATPLYVAAANGHNAVVELLLANDAATDAPREDGNAPIHVAAANCHVEVVRTLLAFGASVEAENDSGQTALDLACVMYAELERDRVLVESALAPLIGAVRSRNRTVAEVLSDTEDPDLQVRSGKTALMYAAINRDRRMVEILVEAGSDLDLVDYLNWTALHYAAHEQAAGPIRALRGADTEIMNNGSLTPLMVAVDRLGGRRQTVAALLDVDADPNTQSEETGNTALHLAAMFGNFPAVEELMQRGADPSIRNADRQRPRQMIGQEVELTRAERVALQNAISGDSPSAPQETRDLPSDELAAGIEIARDGDDDDTFSTGEVVAFLLIPPLVLFVCMSGFVLYQRRRSKIAPLEKKKSSGMERLSALFPQFGQRRTVMDVDPHIRKTDRAVDLEGYVRQDPGFVSVSLVPSDRDISLQFRLLPDDPTAPVPSSSKREIYDSAEPSSSRGYGEITPAPPVELARSRALEEETPRLPTHNPFAELSSGESTEFKDAREKFSTTGSLMSSAKSEEFKDALEQPDFISTSSGKATGTTEFHSAEEELTAGTGGTQTEQPRLAVVDSFVLESLGTIESRGPSSETPPPGQQRTGSSDLALEPVLQQPPEASVPLDSFAVQTFTDTTTSLDSTGLTPPGSRNLSLEVEEPPAADPGEGPVRVRATGQITDPHAEQTQSHHIPSFAVQSFGSDLSEASQSRASTGFTFDRPSVGQPTAEGHPIALMSSGTSTISYGQERSPSEEASIPRTEGLQPHQVMLSSKTSTESYRQGFSSDEARRPSSGEGQQSVQGHRISIVSSQSSIESAGQQGRRLTSEETQRQSSLEGPASVQGHRISLMSSRTSGESYGTEGQGTPRDLSQEETSLQGHQINILSSQSSIESAGMEGRQSSRGT